MNTTTDSTPATSATIKPGFFPGSLGTFQRNAALEARTLGLTWPVCHKIGMDYGADLGTMMKNDPEVSNKVGKARKDGDSSLAIVAKGTCKQSRPMSIVRVAQQVRALKKEGLITSARVELSEPLATYIEECERWTADKQFAEVV